VRTSAPVTAKQGNIHVAHDLKALEKEVPQIRVGIRVLTFVKK
jgi:hypothetical protein